MQLSPEVLAPLVELSRIIAYLGGGGGLLRAGMAVSRFMAGATTKLDEIADSMRELNRLLGSVVGEVSFIKGKIS